MDLAYNLWGHQDLVCPLMDARRNQTYTGLYEFTEDGMNILVESCAVGIEEILEKINEYGRPVVFLGDGVPVFQCYNRRKMQSALQLCTGTFKPSARRCRRCAWNGIL